MTSVSIDESKPGAGLRAVGGSIRRSCRGSAVAGDMSLRAEAPRTIWPHLSISWLLVGAAGLIEGLYGRTQYQGDAISYLNVSRAVSEFAWARIFDPMWNPGYPALVALARSIAPSNAEGEWYAVTLLNWIIFLSAFVAWQYLIRASIAICMPNSRALATHPVAIWTTSCVFLGCNLGLDNVSRVYPDLLVTTLFLLAAGLLLRLIERQNVWDAAALGTVLGLGICIKGIFNAFLCIFLLTLLFCYFARRIQGSLLGIVTGISCVLLACYVAAISWSYGELTLGATGALNYAWHVNELPHWQNWQGGPPPFGLPTHPTRQVFPGLPVFEFAYPFHSTYPPYNNVAYWYQGFRQFFSPERQLIAIARSIYDLARIAVHHPIVPCTAAGLLVYLLKPQWRRAIRSTAKSLWPVGLPALAGFGTYIAVGRVNDYYISAFVLVFALFSLAPLLDTTLTRRGFLAGALVLIYTMGALAELAFIDGSTISAALRLADFHADPQWRLSAALSAYGLKRDDPVAVIRDSVPPYRCDWAYLSGLRIVAEFGSVPFRLAPADRTNSIVQWNQPFRTMGKSFGQSLRRHSGVRS